MQPVDRFHDRVDGGVESDGDIGAAHIIVHRLGDADDRDPLMAEVARRPQSVVAADGDDGIDGAAGERRFDAGDPIRLAQRVGPGRAQNGAALRQDPGDSVARERDHVVGHEPPPAVPHADDLQPLLPGPPDHGPDGGIEARHIPTACEHRDPVHRPLSSVSG